MWRRIYEQETGKTEARLFEGAGDHYYHCHMEKPHCFVASERVDEVAKDAFDRMIAFIKSELAE